ncbi:MAG TPA: L,D-transpeptidase [Thermoanaerobaculia bacterium]|nr:L,D-transpeptidase [Thermoanaerobaculia bacterium]
MRLHCLLLASVLTFGACTFEDATDEPAETAAPTGRPESEGISVPARDYAAYNATSLESQRLDPSWRGYAERDRARRLRGPGGAGAPAGATSDLVLPEPQPPLTSDLGVDTTEPTAPPPGAEGGSQDRTPSGSAGGESFEAISPAALQGPPTLPVPQEGGGPSALRVQILLDRARFSPGILDGQWGKNTEKAVYWFQHARGLEATGEVDRATWSALRSAPGQERPFLKQTRVTPEDLKGPFVPIPEDVYAQAKLDCLCYASPLEQIAERSHSTTDLLRQLNPGVDLENLTAGTTLWVPDVPAVIPPDLSLLTRGSGSAGTDGQTPEASRPAGGQTRPGQAGQAGRAVPRVAGQVERLVISKRGFYLHALDGQGNILFHFPSTLGSDYDPSPGGEHKLTLIKRFPDFHYQPELFHEVPDTEEDAFLPPGPNSPVGLVWMQLSKPNYGIHGTAVPDTIGYTSSHGCIRLTNWDALFLADHVRPGVQVEFVD